MDDPVASPSPQLLAANRRLYDLRARAQAQRVGVSVSHCSTAVASPRPPTNAIPTQEGIPAHLGWGSAALTAVLRRHNRQPTNAAATGERAWTARPPQTPAAQPSANRPADPSALDRSSAWVKLYPDIGLGMLRREMAASGRLWLLLHHLDWQGSGQLRIDIIKQTLTRKSSALRLCGKRQLRNLLRAGEGVFWTRDKRRVWLFSAARAAYALDVARLSGRPVAVPVAGLLTGIGDFRAHLYAAFHSGRARETSRGVRLSPIARETLAGLSGVGRSSQRAYEARANVRVRANFAVGELAQAANRENRAWQKGTAVFELTDYRGQQGKKGRTYLAWQMPNSYSGQHEQRPNGRQKRINRQLKDLVMKGMPGNVEGAGETPEAALKGVERPEKLYYPNGKLAAKAYGRVPQRELYWRRYGAGNGRFAVWQRLGGGGYGG